MALSGWRSGWMRNNFPFLILLALLLSGCAEDKSSPMPSSEDTIVAMIGAIHGQHRRSDIYSLEVLRKAIVQFEPDIIMVELPPDRFETASANFDQYGEVRESRADDFPELIDVVFPLRADMGFEMVPVAAWTQEIAEDRRRIVKRLESDPVRAQDWFAYQAAIRAYNRAVSGKSDDPRFIHSRAYDAAVKDRQETYQRLFGDDLGAGGWQAINAAHLAQIHAGLDKIKGQKKRVLILFGAWHKYPILEGLEARPDIFLVDPISLF